jgi:hypothetical protein
MDIHKPKPWHGLREFLKEYGIIVLGVLTALALEQAVEAVRVQREVTETREAIHAEIARNAMLAKVQLAADSCGNDGGARLLAWANGGAKPRLGMAPISLSLNSTVWDTSKVKGVVHMPLKEQLALAQYYDTIKYYNGNHDLLIQVGLRLVAASALDKLTPDRADRFKEDISIANFMMGYSTINLTSVIDATSALKAEPVPADPQLRGYLDYLDKLCHSYGAPSPQLR